jgi:hypothetical protein
MNIVYAQQTPPSLYSKSIFLVGPTPRDKSHKSWRPEALKYLEEMGYDGVVFVPESPDGIMKDWNAQVEWEKKYLLRADVILAWVPRKFPEFPGMTTNIEVGTFIESGRLFYGRPDWAEKKGYLDWLYKDRTNKSPHNNLKSLIKEVLEYLGDGALRIYGEQSVPLSIWRLPEFQNWYKAQISVGNILNNAKVLWVYPCNGPIFSFSLLVKMWVGLEQRYKENEFVLSRRNTVSAVLYYKNVDDWLYSSVILIREYRSASCSADCFVHELPGGSSKDPSDIPSQVIADEIKQETGLEIAPERFIKQSNRQIAATFSMHKNQLYFVRLTDDEINYFVEVAAAQKAFGEDSEEITYVEVYSIKSLLESEVVDWPTLGMILEAARCGGETYRTAEEKLDDAICSKFYQKYTDQYEMVNGYWEEDGNRYVHFFHTILEENVKASIQNDVLVVEERFGEEIFKD